jgi:Domain of unknown function (DUF4159)/Aerotolerance regulator N-terminal
MLAFGSVAFASPWLLLALAGLPVIWWLLRVTPPTPRRIPFPAIRLLSGLVPREVTPARTPLWLILLRMAIAALVIVAAAHPLLNPQALLPGTGPLTLIVDDGWAAANDWAARQAALDNLLAEAEREGRQVVLVTTAPTGGDTAPPPLAPIRAADARAAIEALQPKPWPVDRQVALARLRKLSLPGANSAIWLSNGLGDAGGAKALAAYLDERGTLQYLTAGPDQTPVLLAAGERAAKDLSVVLRSLPTPEPRRFVVRAAGGDGRFLADQAVTIAPGASSAVAKLMMPNELRNKTTRIDIEGAHSAGAVVLADERWRRRPVGIAGPANAGGQPLLSDTYYLERALAPFTEIRRGHATDLLKRQLAVLIFADTSPDSPADAAAIEKWVEAGGLLLRFAGPRLAETDDQLMPVRLRRGGRTIGGAMSWEQPAKLAPFAPDSPFAGLPIPDDVTVSRQVLAEPDVDLAAKTWARLADGTPLVTAEKRGHGWIVLVHTTANADWSNLSLSGLFVEMLRRIVAMSQGVTAPSEASLPPIETLDGFGHLQRASAAARPIAGKDLATVTVSPQHPPGFYGTQDARRALNLASGVPKLKPIAGLPADTRRATFGRGSETDLRAPVLSAALGLVLADLLIAYGLRGLLWRRPARVAGALLFAALALAPPAAHADDAFVIRATSELRLAYVRTGDDQVDNESRAGLLGLDDALGRRTAVETGNPLAIDIEADELIFFPLLYWPVTADQPPPSPKAVERINRYLDTGGTILFDTRDGDEQSPGPFGGAAIAAERLRRLTAGINMPPLVPIPPDHVLTKSFYLLHEFPGRWNVGTLWVEPVNDHVNDGVSSVIVGANDWAGAWAIDRDGQPLYAVVPGGEQQREMALRFGINLVMYVLTGNYKSDQVHVPAILERLGQ